MSAWQREQTRNGEMKYYAMPAEVRPPGQGEKGIMGFVWLTAIQKAQD